MKKLIATAILIGCLNAQQLAKAQKIKRFSNHTGISYYFGIPDKQHEKRGGMTNISTTFNYKIKPNYGLGVGVSQGNLEEYPDSFGYNLFSVFLDSRYFFENKLEGAEIYFNPGYAFKIDPAWREGLMLGMGASYPFSRRKHSNWNLSFNYRYQEIKSYNSEFSPTKLHQIGFGVGITFN